MMIRHTGHAIAFHIDATGESQDLQVGSREGIWWLPKETTTDYLILTNQGKNMLPLDLWLYDATGRQAKQKVLLAPAETTRYSIRKLILASGLTGSYGGIKIFTNAHAGSLDSLHFLFDETAGFSAILKMFDNNPNTKLEERDYARTSTWTLRAPMLALSNPDPALAFPPDTKLLPQLFIRNTTAKPIDAALRFNWRAAAATGKAPGPTVHLFPYETRRVDIAALQNGAILPKEANWTSVTISTDGKPDEIMAVAASYDATLRYGAQTPFSDQLTFKWEGGMWEYDAYHDSIITAGNGGTKPTQAAFTIFYNQGSQRYDLEQTLQPDEQMWIDVGKLIREHVPDKNGKALPADLISGSYEFRDLINTGVGTLFEGKVIYDKTHGHVAYGCAACCGWGASYPWYNPIGVPFGGPADQGVNAPDWCNGGVPGDVSTAFYYNWSSGSTAIATVNSYGVHTGVSVGSTSSQSHGTLNNNDSRRLCPALGQNPSGGVNVAPTISGPNTLWWFNGLSAGVSGYANQINLTASTGGTGTSFQWAITAGSNKVSLSSSTSATVQVTSIGQSTTANDVSITVTVGGLTSNPFKLTVRAPYSLGQDPAHPSPIYSTDQYYVWHIYIPYRILDNLLTPLPSIVNVQENWTASATPDYTGENWIVPTAGCGPTDSATPASFGDTVQGEVYPSNAYPIPVYNTSQNGAAVFHIGQEWRIGTCASGSGPRVQTDTLQKYTDHAAHTGITSPAP